MHRREEGDQDSKLLDKARKKKRAREEEGAELDCATLAKAILENSTFATAFHNPNPIDSRTKMREAKNITPTHGKILEGDVRRLSDWLSSPDSKSYNINQCTEHLSQPLHWAAQWGDPDMVQALLKAGADPKALNQGGLHCLFFAARSNDKRGVIELLITSGVPVPATLQEILIFVDQAYYFNAKASIGSLAKWAEKNNRADILKNFITILSIKGVTFSPEHIPALSLTEKTALMPTLLNSKNWALLQTWLSSGTDADNSALRTWSDENGCNLYHYFVSLDAPPTFLDWFGRLRESLYLLPEKDKSPQEFTPLALAAYTGNLRIFDWMLEQSLSLLDWRHSNGSRLLLVASAAGHLNIVVRLSLLAWEQQALPLISILRDPTSRGDRQLFAEYDGILRTSKISQWDMPKLPDIAEYNSEGLNPVTAAIARGQVEIVRFFLGVYFEDLLLTRSLGRPYHTAAQYNQPGVLELLKTKGYPYGEDNNGLPPVAYAAGYGSLEALKWFLNDPVLITWRHPTTRLTLALQAVKHGQLAVLQHLFSLSSDDSLASARIQQGDLAGYDILAVAVVKRHLDIVKLITQKFPHLLKNTYPKTGDPKIQVSILELARESKGTTDAEKLKAEAISQHLAQCLAQTPGASVPDDKMELSSTTPAVSSLAAGLSQLSLAPPSAALAPRASVSDRKDHKEGPAAGTDTEGSCESEDEKNPTQSKITKLCSEIKSHYEDWSHIGDKKTALDKLLSDFDKTQIDPKRKSFVDLLVRLVVRSGTAADFNRLVAMCQSKKIGFPLYTKDDNNNSLWFLAAESGNRPLLLCLFKLEHEWARLPLLKLMHAAAGVAGAAYFNGYTSSVLNKQTPPLPRFASYPRNKQGDNLLRCAIRSRRLDVVKLVVAVEGLLHQPFSLLQREESFAGYCRSSDLPYCSLPAFMEKFPPAEIQRIQDYLLPMLAPPAPSEPIFAGLFAQSAAAPAATSTSTSSSSSTLSPSPNDR